MPGKPADALCVKCNAPLQGSYSAGPGQEPKASNEWDASPSDDPATPLPEWALQADIELEKSNILLLVRLVRQKHRPL